MDISSLAGVLGAEHIDAVKENTLLAKNPTEDFESVLASAMNMLSETNELQNDAQAAKIQFALGEAENPHDMQIAAAKALNALQYTTAVRDRMIEAYREIMNMQI